MKKKEKENVTEPVTSPTQEVFMENPTTPVENNELETLKNNIAKLEEENKDLTSKIKMSQAELINYRKRKDEEVSNMLKYANEGLVKELITFVENYERALNQAEKSENPEVQNYVFGFKMITDQIKAILEKDGLKEIKALNEKFDPNFHQAMSKEKRDGVEPGIVIEVIQTGYMYKDRLLRPAMVKVSE